MQEDFYASLQPEDQFLHLAQIERYRAVPDDTVLFLGDVVNSTGAIEGGRYKEVNVAAAAIIAAISNALPARSIAFSFGGDGASFVLPSALETVGRGALAGAVCWAQQNLGLKLRAAAVPVSAIRQAGLDLRLARFAVTPDLSYAMFAGGGLTWSDAAMKDGRFAIQVEEEATAPDLSGLTCSFSSLPTRNGVILSLIAVPVERTRLSAFAGLIAELLALAQKRDGDVRPLHRDTLKMGWSARNFLTETRIGAARIGRRTVASLLRSGARSAIANFTLRTKTAVAGFDPRRYLDEVVRNTDFRKFDDGLRMTLDCAPETADAIEHLLAQGRAKGLVAFGTHRQTEAMLTCFVPSPRASDHVHFIDGAAGGYAFAAQALKMQLASP